MPKGVRGNNYDITWIIDNFEYREGKIYRLKTSRRWKQGQRAGTKGIKYRYVGVHGKVCLEHRVIWILVTGINPDCDIDHINGDKLDNRIENLRLATRGQNNINSLPQKNNTSGFKGAYYDKRRDCWYAEIWVNNKKVFLGRHPSAEDAGNAYTEAAKKYFGERFLRAA